DPLRAADEGPPQLGGTSRIEHVLATYQVERVIFAFSRLPAREQIELFQRCMELGVQVDIVPRLYEVMGSRMQVHDVDGLLIVFAPLLAFTALRIKLESPGPVLFWQERMGAGGRRFRIVKFRTMYADAEERKADLAHLNKHTE